MAVRKALRLPTVMEATGYAKPTIYKRIKEGKFPPGHRLGGARVRVWFDDEIEAYQNGTWTVEQEAA